MPTIRTVTVKPSGGDYTSLAAAEAGEQADLPALDRVLYIACDAMSLGPLIISGWVTDATHYIRIYAAAGQGHEGKWIDTRARIDVTDDNGILINEPYVRIEGLQVRVTKTTGSTPRVGIGHIAGSLTGGEIRVERCIVRGNFSGSVTGQQAGIRFNDASPVYKIGNNLVYDFGIAGGSMLGIGYTSVTAGAGYLYNNTVVDCDTGIQTDGGGMVAKNNLAEGCGDGYAGTFASGSSNNASSLAADAPGTAGRNSQTFSFLDRVGNDFHLASGDLGALGFGANLAGDASYPLSLDLDGDTRAAPWDIGADQYAAAVGGGTDGALLLRRHRLWTGGLR